MRVCPHARLFGACGCVSGREGPESHERTNDACVSRLPPVSFYRCCRFCVNFLFIRTYRTADAGVGRDACVAMEDMQRTMLQRTSMQKTKTATNIIRALKTAEQTVRERDIAVRYVQRVWRGIRARRVFGDLFFAHVDKYFADRPEKALGLLYEATDERTARRREEEAELRKMRALFELPSLEDAFTEAHYKYNHHVTGETMPGIATASRRQTISGAEIASRGDADGQPRVRPRTMPASAPTSPLPTASALSSSAASPGASLSNARASKHKRHMSESAAKFNTSASMAAQEIDAETQFTAEAGERMSVEQVRELASVLSRIIDTRNKELVALLEKQDELRQQRDASQATVQALVAQVDKSRFVHKTEGVGTKLGGAAMGAAAKATRSSMGAVAAMLK